MTSTANDIGFGKNWVLPGPSSLPGLPSADLLWDGTGSGNGWEKNRYGTSIPDVLPGCDDALLLVTTMEVRTITSMSVVDP